MDDKNLYREIPRVDKLLELFDESYNIDVLKYCINQVLNGLRIDIKEKEVNAEVSVDVILDKIKEKYSSLQEGSLKKVINATGTVIHTNLGRSPIKNEHYLKAGEIATAYSNIEFDLKKGIRGSRYSHITEYIRYLTAREEALIVNNNAAAVFLVLNSLCKGANVIISRGELVEIGGSFRIPEVIRESGAIIKEVGTTNKTKLSDYEGAIDESTKIILKVHRSNFKITGFTEDVMAPNLAALARKHNLISYFDIGSGAMNPLVSKQFNEPCVIDEALKDVDIISFSGDKLLGGPQSGIIAGKKALIDILKHNQLLRMLRVDKITLSILQETLKDYIFAGGKNIPVIQLILQNKEEQLKKCKILKELLENNIKDKINLVEIKEDLACIGGGSCPEEYFESYAVFLSFKNFVAEDIKKKLLHYRIPIIVRVKDEKVLINTLTLLVDDINLIIEALKWVITT
jgi:L-seryl-tRNA(Ser) seleniumtransferase